VTKVDASDPVTIPVIAGDNAIFVCPKCETTKTVDISKYKDIETPIRLRAKCGCGHVYPVLLEKRDRYRKKTNLTGEYVNVSSGKKNQKGQMTVLDVSRTGLKIKINQLQVKVKDHDVYTSKVEKVTFGHKVQKIVGEVDLGDKVWVRFNLDNAQNSLIKRKVIVRWINKPFLGVQFSDIQMYDATLGFYLMS